MNVLYPMWRENSTLRPKYVFLRAWNFLNEQAIENSFIHGIRVPGSELAYDTKSPCKEWIIREMRRGKTAVKKNHHKQG